ncbi:Fc.00g098860.m01.CDS01 [Cosmosporella sp. VM-42]
MPPPPKDSVPKAAAPLHAAGFDPWNSSSTGHQRPENRPGTGWRESRNKKLNSQFRAGESGGQRMSDTWGAGSEDWDEKHKTLIPKNVRERATGSVMDMLVKPEKMQESLGTARGGNAGEEDGGLTREELEMEERKKEDEKREADKGLRGIFDGVVVYVNGSTYPLVSDLKLKQLLTEHGGQMSLHLGRRRVTHVILGRPAGSGRGAGGGLAGSKLEKEIKKVGGCGVKFVGAEWVLESIKVGKRLPEARFSNMKIAPKGQSSVYGLYTNKPTQS